jgi:ankyrin repeat protein
MSEKDDDVLLDAAMHGHPSIVVALLAAAATPQTEDKDSITALDLADDSCRILIEAKLI